MFLTEDEDLRLVTGMIMRVLVLANTPIECFCAAKPFNAFPTNGSQTWMREFRDFADYLHENGMMKDR